MKKKILIIGGTGFIGYHFSKKCLSHKFEVTSLSRSKPSKTRKLKNVKYIFADISNKRNLKLKIKKEYDYIVNFGGDVDHHGKNTFKSHFKGCKNLAEIFQNKKIKKFIQMGSSVEYGKNKSPHAEKNLIKINPKLNSIYARAKLSSTKFLLKLFKNRKFPVTIFRLYLTYGPKQDANRIIPFTILQCLKNKEFPCSKGDQYRDFIYIDDVVNILFKSLDYKGAEGQIFNICSNQPVQIKRVINLIKSKCKGGKPQFGLILMRKDEVMKFYGDLKKTSRFFNWKPKINLASGLNRTIKYYENNFKN